MIAQCATQTVNHNQLHSLKLTIRKKNREQQSLAADSVYAQLSPSLQQCVDLARESGSFSWLTVLSIEKRACHLHKGYC